MKYHPLADIPGLNESHCLTSHRERRPSGAVVRSVEEPLKGHCLEWEINSLGAFTPACGLSCWGPAGLQRLDRHETSPSKYGRQRLRLETPYVCACVCVELCPTLCDSMDCSPPSMEFPRQEYWSGFPFPSPGDLPNPGSEFVSPALTGRFFTTGTTWEAWRIPSFSTNRCHVRHLKSMEEINTMVAESVWVTYMETEHYLKGLFLFFFRP